jgi:hypothetical protein
MADRNTLVIPLMFTGNRKTPLHLGLVGAWSGAGIVDSSFPLRYMDELRWTEFKQSRDPSTCTRLDRGQQMTQMHRLQLAFGNHGIAAGCLANAQRLAHDSNTTPLSSLAVNSFHEGRDVSFEPLTVT